MGKGARERALSGGLRSCSSGGFAGCDSVGGGAFHVEGSDDGLSLEQVPNHLLDGGKLLTMVALRILPAIPEAERQDTRVFCVRYQDSFIHEPGQLLENCQNRVMKVVGEFARLDRYAG